MTDMIIFKPQENEMTVSEARPVDGWIAIWLHAKANRSHSAETLAAYRDDINNFRDYLMQHGGHDLDSNPKIITVAAQKWPSLRRKAIDGINTWYEGAPVAGSTFNLRLAVISSFYEFALKHDWLDKNPIKIVERGKVQNQPAMPLDTADVKSKLGKIDRSTTLGKRDFALLSVALMTGRRLSELAGLRWSDVQIAGNQVTLFFRRTKGGKNGSNTLPRKTADALLDYQRAAYPGIKLNTLTEEKKPIWISESPRTRGKGISTQTVADIFQKHLGVSKVHSSRHTFAHEAEKQGAPVSTIQSMLGHESLQITGRYLASMHRPENPVAAPMEESMIP